MSMRLMVAVSALTIGLLCDAAAAQGRSQGRGRGNTGSSGGTDVAVSAVVIFGDSDRTTFRNYFVTNKITAQPLPPGIAKNVARGKPLPPGIAKKALPAGLLALAPRVDRDVTFAIVGDVVVAHRSGVVVDVMVGLFK
jgi:hypothetical protein